MDGADRDVDTTFRVSFTKDGAARLRVQVREKLKEFMGDYTDDTLVEYVIVLLKNGRRKEEAKNELNVFLGDDSDSFVSWLWDHLQSDIHLYAQEQESRPNEADKLKLTSGGQVERIDPVEPEREMSNKLSKTRNSKELKSLVRSVDEPPPLRSAVIANIHTEEETHESSGHAKRSPSPRLIQRKRGRANEELQKDSTKARISAPRRLLQFAVRDAVATSRTSSLTSDPSSKRLRSVVSTSVEDSSLEDRRQRIRSVARVPNAMAVAIKAVAEAANDVKVKSSGNVFDRLGRGIDVPSTTVHMTENGDSDVEADAQFGDLPQIPKRTLPPTYHQRLDYSGQYVRKIDMLDGDIGLTSGFASVNEDYDNSNATDRRAVDVSETGTSGGNVGGNSMMLQYAVANHVDEIGHKSLNDQDQPVVSNFSTKIMNLAANVNIWKSLHYQEPREVSVMDNPGRVQENEPAAVKSGVRLMKENSNPVTVSNTNAIPVLDAQGESQKTMLSTGSYSTGRPTDDADSRTIFVSNVHFAATKDSLSRHFNKFGDVLKVIIITDAATGQPRGSAYVEFMRKEAAEHALSLDGTSFMSRILKIVRKSSAQQDVMPVTWPRVTRGSPYATSRFARVPFPRGIPSIYRPRLPVKPGARSLQWKRDAQIKPPESNSSISSIGMPSPTARSLTYVRAEAKTDGDSSGTAS